MTKTNNPQSATILQLTRGFWGHLSSRRRKQLFILLFLLVAASFAEVLSLGAVLPFLGVLTQPQRVLDHPAIQPILARLQISTAQELLLPVTLVFCLAALLAGGMRLLLLYANNKLSTAIGADFSHQIYRTTLYQPYSVHVSRNSSEIVSGVTGKVSAVIVYFLTPMLTLLSSMFLLAAILFALIMVNPGMTLAAVAGFGLIYGVIILFSRKYLAEYSRRISLEQTKVIKVLQEGLGGIRDVLINNAQEVYCAQYRAADIPLRHAHAGSAFIGIAPRFAVESLGMVFIAILAYSMSRRNLDTSNTITLLGAMAIGAQRLLPVLQMGYQSLVNFRSGRYSLQDALALLNQPIDEKVYGPAVSELPFQRVIELRNLGFRYSRQTPPVLHDLNLLIPRGSRTGFMGVTGSGKSTLLDIIMGLLTPTKGEILIDDTPLQPQTQRAWQRRIAHVPQAIYLSDSSIVENIAFGLPPDQIDRLRAEQAAAQAQLANFITSLPKGYDTRVGERGVRLSGGQRQRIGIARALYNQASVLVFDEATSALDNETEQAVMRAIDGLDQNLTILIIAHRLTTLQGCDQIVEMEQGRVKRVGKYAEMVGNQIENKKRIIQPDALTK